jgi:hypothetical protein
MLDPNRVIRRVPVRYQIWRNTGVCALGTVVPYSSVAEPEPRAEIKLPTGAGAEIIIAAPAPAPFYLSKIEEILWKKHGC